MDLEHNILARSCDLFNKFNWLRMCGPCLQLSVIKNLLITQKSCKQRTNAFPIFLEATGSSFYVTAIDRKFC